jgi:hypothetical protein
MEITAITVKSSSGVNPPSQGIPIAGAKMAGAPQGTPIQLPNTSMQQPPIGQPPQMPTSQPPQL